MDIRSKTLFLSLTNTFSDLLTKRQLLRSIEDKNVYFPQGPCKSVHLHWRILSVIWLQYFCSLLKLTRDFSCLSRSNLDCCNCYLHWQFFYFQTYSSCLQWNRNSPLPQINCLNAGSRQFTHPNRDRMGELSQVRTVQCYVIVYNLIIWNKIFISKIIFKA